MLSKVEHEKSFIISGPNGILRVVTLVTRKACLSIQARESLDIRTYSVWIKIET